MDSIAFPRKHRRFCFKIHHDMALLAQVGALNPISGSPRPKLVWEQIAANLSSSRLVMEVTGRSCRDRAQMLYERLVQVNGVTEAVVTEWLKKPGLLLQKLRQLKKPTSGSANLHSTSNVGHKPSKHCKVVITPARVADKEIPEDCDPLSPEEPPQFTNIENSDSFAGFHNQTYSGPASRTHGGTGGVPKEDFGYLSYRLIAIEKQLDYLVRWTERQDAVNTEIFCQLRTNREAADRNVVGLPNPCVRLERLDSHHEGHWRSTRSSPTKPKKNLSTPKPALAQMAMSSSAVVYEDENTCDSFDLDDAPVEDISAPASEGDAPITVKVEIEEPKSMRELQSTGEDFDLEGDVEGFMAMAAGLAAGPPAKEKTVTKKQMRPVGSFPCSICAKKFTQPGSLETHMRNVHEGLRPHVCTTCGKTFSRLDGLKHHELIHSSERNFKCRHCDSSFRQRQGLYIHERYHQLGSKYGRSQCPQCGQLFVLPRNLKQHLRLVHGGVRDFACGLCGKAFKTRTHLKYHEGTHSRPGGRQRGLNRETEGGFRIKRVGGVTKLKQVAEEDTDAAEGSAKEPKD